MEEVEYVHILTSDPKQEIFITKNTWEKGEIRKEARKFARKHSGADTAVSPDIPQGAV